MDSDLVVVVVEISRHLGVVDSYVGKYYSVEWIRKNVLRQTEDEIKEIDKQIAAEPDTAEDEMAAQQQQHDQQTARQHHSLAGPCHDCDPAGSAIENHGQQVINLRRLDAGDQFF